MARGLPMVGVSHMAGHVYSAWLSDVALEPPYLALVVSGGHSDVVELRDHGDAVRLASTRDDAAGEAFDKAARLLGLGYPGGPAIERAARGGDPARFAMPRTRLPGALSFSGLKTALRYTVRDLGADALTEGGTPRDPAMVADLAASFQAAVVDQLLLHPDHDRRPPRRRAGGRRRWCRGQPGPPRGRAGALQRPSRHRPAAAALHRQRRHDRCRRLAAPAAARRGCPGVAVDPALDLYA